MPPLRISKLPLCDDIPPLLNGIPPLRSSLSGLPFSNCGNDTGALLPLLLADDALTSAAFASSIFF